MTPSFQDLVSSLEARFTDPAKREIVAALAADATLVAAQAITDPVGAAKEAGFLRATASNLTAEEAAFVSDGITQWLAAFVRAAVIAR